MHIHRSLLAVAVTLAVAGVSTAQKSIVLPAEYTLGWGQGSSSGLGGTSTRTQIAFAKPFPANTPILGVGTRSTGTTADMPAFMADLEVRMSSTSVSPGGMSTTFASNVGSDVAVAFPRQVLNFPAMPANRSTGLFAIVPFATPFIFGMNSAPNVLVDMLVYSNTGASFSTDRAFASASGRAATVGKGCGTATVNSTSTTPSYAAGATVTVSLAGAPASSAAILVPSANLRDIGGLPLPFSLGLLGGRADCELLVAPDFGTIPLTTSATGAASVPVTIPAGIGRFGTGWQWLYQVSPSATNPIGIETTANRAIWVGPQVAHPNAGYNYELSNVALTSGTPTTDAVPVVLFQVP